MAKALTGAALAQVRELYGQLDEFGKRLYSQARIADMLGVGETTIFRALKGYGGHARGARELDQFPERILASQESLLARLGADIEQAKERGNLGEKLLDELQERGAGELREVMEGNPKPSGWADSFPSEAKQPEGGET